MAGSRLTRILICLAITALALPLLGQQTGTLSGRVTAVDGSALPGVTVEARSNVLPQPRVTTTGENGEYRLPALPPGAYQVTFTLAGMETRTRNVQVLLQQDQQVNASLGVAGVAETITVTADATMIDPQSAEIKSALPENIIEQLPTGQEYRDLVKLIPAVTYSEDTVRGPSAGGSGQDNVYQFDGVNVTLPLFGTLSAEPATHDIAQIAVIKGGAKAVDFNRAAGFTIDSVSKSGTSDFSGTLSYQLRTNSMRGSLDTASASDFDEDRSWATVNFGGPVLRDRLYFYTSYYRPVQERGGRSNLYGQLPDYKNERDEYFGKLTFTPTSSILLHGSYRNSERDVTAAAISAENAHPTTSEGESAKQTIGILEGSWVINDRSFATFKINDYNNKTGGRPDLILNVPVSIAPGTQINTTNLDQLGWFQVPSPVTGATAYNAFIQPLIDRYGYTSAAGVKTGGGRVGAASQINNQDFFRESFQAAYDITFGSALVHDVHVGLQRFTDSEDLRRISNGWGNITVPGGRVNCPASGINTITPCAGQPIFYQAEFTRMSLADATIGNIHSEYVSNNFEVNDTIRWNNWSFNLGVLLSNDILYGQGLREDSSTLSGYALAPGNKYKMHEIGWGKMIQPRLGATWNYNGSDSVYANYARYNPSTSSLPRAASWDRNALGLTYRVFFDQTGTLMGVEQVSSSSGKLFADDLDPRYTDEYLIGTAQQITSNWGARFYGRHRYSANFWEDTNNDARFRWAPEGYPKDLYIPDLSAKLAQIGSGSTYVIAQLDDAFTKYYEVTAESDARIGRSFVRGSYTWSQYYGNFDQDTTTVVNDQNIFIGSSNLADGVGRNVWDNKYGWLRGDRRHMLKLLGTYSLPWNASVGAFGIYQSGHPWQMESIEPYRLIPGFSGSATNRYAEAAGSRRTPAHHQVDLSYTQNIPVMGLNFQLALDVFNIYDNQTGYNPQPLDTSPLFGQARDYFDPRRWQVAARLQF